MPAAITTMLSATKPLGHSLQTRILPKTIPEGLNLYGILNVYADMPHTLGIEIDLRRR